MTLKKVIKLKKHNHVFKKDILFVFQTLTVSPHVWLRQVNEQEWARREEGRKREGVHESNALQQRTVTDQAFIWAETAAVEGRTQEQQRRQQHSELLYYSVPLSQLETRWTQRGGDTGITHWEHNTSLIPPPVWFLDYYIGFSSFALQHMSSLFLLTLFSPFTSCLWFDFKEYSYQQKAWLKWELVPAYLLVRH